MNTPHHEPTAWMVRLVKNTKTPMSQPWPDDCWVQGGGNFRDEPDAAFVEAFPTDPSTMIRVNAPTVTEAETRAYEIFLRYLACAKHEFEPRKYKNGSGVCQHCKMWSSGVFTLEEVGALCAICSVPTNWRTIGDRQVCEEHSPPSWADFWSQLSSWVKEGADTSELGVLGWIVPHVDIRDFLEESSPVASAISSVFSGAGSAPPSSVRSATSLYADACALWLDDQVSSAR